MITYFIKGGPIMIPIAICSITAGAFIIAQWYRIREAKKLLPLRDLKLAIQNKDWYRAYQLTCQFDHLFLIPWQIGFYLLREGKSDFRDIEEAVKMEGEKIVSELEKNLRALAAVIPILPMLGFLGTITGLILSFATWEQLGSQISINLLAGGIYQAMITTAAGLITAIPYQLIHSYLSGKTNELILRFSEQTTELFRLIKESLLQESSIIPDEAVTSSS